jgi:hypothetical protein
MESARRFLYDEDEQPEKAAAADNVQLPAPHTSGATRLSQTKRLNPIVAAMMATLGTCNNFGLKRALHVITIVCGVILLGKGVHSFIKREEHTKSVIRFETIHSKIVSSGFTSVEALDKKGTAQYHAMRWLAGSDEASLDPEDPSLLQRYAVAVFFYSLGEDKDHVKPESGWKSQQGWMTEAGYCTWYGIACLIETGFKATGNGMIETISLESNALKGKLPSELAALENLGVLNLGKNQIEGSLPTELVSLKELRSLILRDNSIDGTLPAAFGDFKSLRQLHLGGNNLTGAIPKEIENAFTLKALALNNNQFGGTVPELIELEYLCE